LTIFVLISRSKNSEEQIESKNKQKNESRKKDTESHSQGIESKELAALLEDNTQLTENFSKIYLKKALEEKFQKLENIDSTNKKNIKNYIFKKFEILESEQHEENQIKNLEVEKFISLGFKEDKDSQSQLNALAIDEKKRNILLDKIRDIANEIYFKEIKKGMSRFVKEELNKNKSYIMLMNEIDDLINKKNQEDGKTFDFKKFETEFEEKISKNTDLCFDKIVKEIKVENDNSQFLTNQLSKINKKIDIALGEYWQKVQENPEIIKIEPECNQQETLDQRIQRKKKEIQKQSIEDTQENQTFQPEIDNSKEEIKQLASSYESTLKKIGKNQNSLSEINSSNRETTSS